MVKDGIESNYDLGPLRAKRDRVVSILALKKSPENLLYDTHCTAPRALSDESKKIPKTGLSKAFRHRVAK